MALWWMFVAIVLYILFAFLYTQIAGAHEQEEIAEAFGPVAVQVLLVVILAAVGEELCFRGMLFSGLRERLPMFAAALISGGIFGALHAVTGLSAVPPLIAFGTIMAWLYERTGSIIPCMVVHALNNSLALLAQ
jgi:membrane protease YdiL (CAAX protease family)